MPVWASASLIETAAAPATATMPASAGVGRAMAAASTPNTTISAMKPTRNKTIEIFAATGWAAAATVRIFAPLPVESS